MQLRLNEGGALIQYDWYPYKKRDPRNMCMHKERRLSTSHEVAPGETKPVSTLILDFQTPELWENVFFKPQFYGILFWQA